MTPYQLVKDQRTQHQHTNVQGVLDGDLLDEYVSFPFHY